jgi:hypothetical protein
MDPTRLQPNGPADRSRGSYYPMGRWIGVVYPTYGVDPVTHRTGGLVLWIQLPSGSAIGAVDPNGQQDRCREYFPMGHLMCVTWDGQY